MSAISVLSVSSGKSFLRDKGVVFALVILPILLLVIGKESEPTETVFFVLDNNLLFTDAEKLGMTLYSLTAVVLVSSVASFYISYNMRDVIPRLRITGYSSLTISLSFIILISVINIIISAIVWIYTINVIEVEDSLGFYVGLLLVSIIMSTIGLIISELFRTKTLGLYILLALTMIDTSFVENPVFSRRYDDDWIAFMPSHNSVIMLFRSVYGSPIDWTEGGVSILIYELILILFYFLVKSRRK